MAKDLSLSGYFIYVCDFHASGVEGLNGGMAIGLG